MSIAIVVLVVAAAVLFALVWWRRRRPARQIAMNDSYERAKAQAHLQAQHTRDDFGSPVNI